MKASLIVPMCKCARLLTIVAAGICSVFSAGAVGFFLNANFEAGNTGFGSDLTYVANPPFGLTENGVYSIASNPSHWFFNWANIGDHTTGSGSMLLATPNPGDARVWYQSVDVVEGITYTFGGWAAHVDIPNPNIAVLSIKAGNTSIGTFDLSAFAQGAWAPFAFEYTAQASGSVEFSISSLTPSNDGNDFALDDLTFAPIPEPGIASLLIAGVPALLIFRRRAS